MSHSATYLGSYSLAFMTAAQRVLRPTLHNGSTVQPHITHSNDYYRAGTALHGGIDFNYVEGQSHPLNQRGVSQVYSSVAGTLEHLSPGLQAVTPGGNGGGDGAVFIREAATGVVHGFIHFDSLSSSLRNAAIGSWISLDTPLGYMGGRQNGDPNARDVHVHYSVYTPEFNRNDTSTWNKIDPIVYWTPGVNPHAPVDANGRPTGTGLYVASYASVDLNNDGTIDTQGVLKEGEWSTLHVGVNTPHTQAITLRVTFSGLRPDSLLFDVDATLPVNQRATTGSLLQFKEVA